MRPSNVLLRHLPRWTAVVLGATLLAQAPSARVRASVSTPYASERRTQIAPGVFHDRGTIETTTAGRQAVHFVEVDTAEAVIRVEALISNDRVSGLETSTANANRRNGEGHRAVAVINGDFWGPQQEPGGIHIQGGELIVAGPDARPTVGVKPDGRCVIGTPRVNGSLVRPGGAALALGTVNHPRRAGSLAVYTARFAAATGTDSSGTEVVLGGVVLPLPASGSSTGTVRLVRPGAGNTPVAADEVVLSGTGAAGSFLSTLAVNDQVELALSITADWADVEHAVGGGHWLVRDGVVDPTWDPGFSDVTHPRTAVGVTSDGDLVTATVDGRQPGYSIGVRLDELAELMRDRGAVWAINMDGGGSSATGIRLPGDDGVTQVNRGSDGFERAVSNSLGVFSAAPTGPLAVLSVFPEDVRALLGSRVSYTAKGQDAAYNAVAVAPSEASWSATGGTGTIDSAGVFVAQVAGQGTVVATAREITGRAEIVVHDTLTALEVSPNPAVVPPASTQAFTLTGRDSAGAAVRVDPPTASWSVTGDVGTMDGNGVLTASAWGTGFVHAAAGGASGSARVDVGRPPLVLEDFEDISDMRALSARGSATLTSAMRPLPVRNGTRSGRMGYDFTTAPAGTSAAYAAHSPWRPIDSRPLRIGIWLYGNGSRHWVRGNFRDGTGAQKVVSFTGAASPVPSRREDCLRRTGGIDWVGWKYLEAPIPGDTVLPMSWERVYVVETSDLCDDAGAVYLDDLRAVYSDSGEDLVGPAVTELSPEPGSTVYTSRPEIGGAVRDGAGGSGVAADSIRLTLDGEQVPAQFDADTGLVRYTPSSPLPDGTHRARLEATDGAGNPALPFGDWAFTIYTGPDRDAPVIDRMQPLQGTVSPAGRPRISARVRDSYRGVDPSTLVLTIDGLAVPATWDPAAGVAWWAPSAPLPDGEHTVALSAGDRESPPNLANAIWSFTVQAVPQPPAAFTFTWIADGGYFEGTKETAATAILGEHLARERASPPALLLFGGDLVENDQQVNYDRALAALDTVPAPRLVAAGNHEISGTLSRERFWRTFGPTVAGADFGPVDFLILDSASSTIGFDGSQFGWIEAELARSDARTVFVVLHVPTRDPFSSGHGLPATDGRRLEAIFAAARAARPGRDIVVLSGDAHAHGAWEQDGVRYVISGGGGGSPDATPAGGGFYHRLHVDVDSGGQATIRVVPLFYRILADPVAADIRAGERLDLAASGDVFTDGAPAMSLPVADPVDRAWTSDGAAVVVLDGRVGLIEGWVPGTAVVTVTSGGATATVQVRVTADLVSLRALTDRALAEGGITHQGTHQALTSQLDQAAGGARGALQGYLQLLRAQRGKKVGAAWADRLTAVAENVGAGGPGAGSP